MLVIFQVRSCAKQEKPQRESDEDKKGKAKELELNYVYVFYEYAVLFCVHMCVTVF